MESTTVKTRDEIQAEVFKWLNTTPYTLNSLTPLIGGSANFIYKATLISPLQDGSSENIEAECFKALADFRVPVKVDNADLPKQGKFNAIVRTPKLHLFDGSTHTQVMEYLPQSTILKPIFIPNCHHLPLKLLKFNTTLSAKHSDNIGVWIAQGYVEGLGALSEEQKWRNAIQVGVHLLAFGPIAGWVSEGEEVVRITRDLFLKAWSKKEKGMV
ncbi:hypothetical protein BKA65DRAFT_543896 [Rhexocercosporidium sp. MPI-PUGE-AT-0058]|nr:hypothetical protein BKA65DRAFT_543896 [Rhexocercosporidium sp. MPI-PUGE-AT-0058]